MLSARSSCDHNFSPLLILEPRVQSSHTSSFPLPCSLARRLATTIRLRFSSFLLARIGRSPARNCRSVQPARERRMSTTREGDASYATGSMSATFGLGPGGESWGWGWGWGGGVEIWGTVGGERGWPWGEGGTLQYIPGARFTSDRDEAHCAVLAFRGN